MTYDRMLKRFQLSRPTTIGKLMILFDTMYIQIAQDEKDSARWEDGVENKSWITRMAPQA